MSTGTGLDAQIGFAAESTWATEVTVTRFHEFNSESLQRTPTFIEPSALRKGTKYKRESRVKQSRATVSGDFELDHAMKGMGLLWKHALGSSITAPTQIAATTAYKQIHTPGDFVGLGMTIQVGRPEPSGTVRAHTFSGCRIVSWEFSLSDNAIPAMTFSVDGRQESTATALATASYLVSSVFDFSQATVFKLGGTAATASGETTITGGTPVTTIVKDFTLSGENPHNTERFGLGNAGLKAQQLENDIPTITGSATAEYSKTELYDKFTNNTTFAMQLDLVGPVIEAGNNWLLSFIMPACKLKAAPPSVEGPDVVPMNIEWEAYSDETNPVLQVKLVSTDTTL